MKIIFFFLFFFSILGNILLKNPFYNSAEIHCWFPLCGGHNSPLAPKNQGLAISCLECLRTQALEPLASSSLSLRCGFWPPPFKAPVRSTSCDIGSEDAVVTPCVRAKSRSATGSRECGERGEVSEPRHRNWPCSSSADPHHHSSSLLILEPLPTPPPRGEGADGEAQARASVTSQSDVSLNVRLAWREPGIWNSSEVEREKVGALGGKKGCSDGVSEEMKVVYARSGCLDRPE